MPEVRLVCEHGHIFTCPENERRPKICQVVIDPQATIKEICCALIRQGQFIPASVYTHKVEFRLTGCHRHFGRHRWWCRKCDRVTEEEFRDTCYALWKLQGVSEDRIIR